MKELIRLDGHPNKRGIFKAYIYPVREHVRSYILEESSFHTKLDEKITMNILPRNRKTHSRDDLNLGTVPLPATENIDFLQFIENEEVDTSYLGDNVNLAACRKYSCYPYKDGRSRLLRGSTDSWQFNKRLENVCWRRMAMNTLRLPHVCPTSINWDKMSDDTWLFGPRVDMDKFRPFKVGVRAAGRRLYYLDDDNESMPDLSDADSATLTLSVFGSDDDYELDLSSESSSSYTHGPQVNLQTIMSTGSSMVLEHLNGNSPCTIKPILKRGKSESFCDERHTRATPRNPQCSSKRVSFSYIVNSREFICNQPFDFQLLDHKCA